MGPLGQHAVPMIFEICSVTARASLVHRRRWCNDCRRGDSVDEARARVDLVASDADEVVPVGRRAGRREHHGVAALFGGRSTHEIDHGGRRFVSLALVDGDQADVDVRALWWSTRKHLDLILCASLHGARRRVQLRVGRRRHRASTEARDEKERVGQEALWHVRAQCIANRSPASRSVPGGLHACDSAGPRSRQVPTADGGTK
jgi:hypothetical protein